ncbi:putative NTP pyrophosphohydrolase protein [Rhizobium phage RHph_Y2_6]|uniref:Putative NTP pyrophosphohydrolase protein n=1 Tax=Rhizobium phage RHph_Y2_6 TaxID=2509576 RepID=A0A7S5UU01_9CAUD|nr:putative NTP pyrophosphohydrolase protein [Rhizobium phage RHph_Y2_6]QIG68796.1 putative NTP pyrophosphohydrolase protein [Rhizobium phage RHph_Y2_6]
MTTENTLNQTLLWFQKAIPNPQPKNVSTQVGVHFEEVAEMLATLDSKDMETHQAMLMAETALKHLSKLLKERGALLIDDRYEFADSIGDQLVTAVGSAHMLGMNAVDILREVNRSNFSKFDENGNPIFDQNLKVMKGPLYSKVDLNPFI